MDICLCHKDTFVYDLPVGVTASTAQIGLPTIQFPDFKNNISSALISRFGVFGVTRGDKALQVHANTYRIDADVIPTFEFRKYYYQGSVLTFITGVCFYTDRGQFIINWPDQTYANGLEKHEKTQRRYRKVVRVLKGLRYEMEDNGSQTAKKISSFQISCLAHNISDFYYGADELYDDVKLVAGQIWYNTSKSELCTDWSEVDQIKPMFPDDLKRQEVNAFFWELMKYASLV